MKTRVCLGLLALLVFGPPLAAYENSPARHMIIPEAIWAAATGGGTWVTQLQVTATTAGTTINVTFHYGTAFRVVGLATTTGPYETLKYTNILATLQSKDPSFDYYGRVGTLWLYTQDNTHPIGAQAMTVNGNYGKTYPALGWVDGNSANLFRRMVIPNIQQNATFRTFVGCFNATSGGTYPMTVTFYVMRPNDYLFYGQFSKTFASREFASFNPFVEAGLGAGFTTSNCWLLIWPMACDNSGIDTRGLMCFGSTANNSTNDSYALIAVPFE